MQKSKLKWEKLFLKVDIIDADFVQAGAHLLQPFNVLETIKLVCSSFNLTFKEAWQLPYSITQTNSLSLATKSFVENELRKIKENKMKQQKNHA